jgi:thymidine phosphorylase
LRTVSCAIAGAMLEVGGVASTESGAGLIETALRSGAARLKLVAMLEAQGGDLDRFDRDFPSGEVVAAAGEGFVTEIDARAIGEIVALAKRSRASDEARRIGVRVVRRVGEAVGAGDPILRYIAVEPEREILRLLSRAVKVGKTKPRERFPLLGSISNVGPPDHEL